MKQLEFREVTVFAGANSSGKSSVIQSILMLIQTLSQRNTNAMLVLNDDLVTLGTVHDAWHRGNLEESLEVEFILDTADSAKKIYCDLAFTPSSVLLQETDVGVYKGSYGLFVDDDNIEGFSVIENPKQREWIVTDSSDPALLEKAVGVEKGLPTTIEVKGMWGEDEKPWRGLMLEPETFVTRRFAKVTMPDKYVSILEDVISSGGYSSIRSRVGKWIGLNQLTFDAYADWFAKRTSEEKQKIVTELTPRVDSITDTFAVWQKTDLVQQIEWNVFNFFTTKVRYLGANRAAPTALFALDAPSSWSEVGIDGSNVATALSQYGMTPISYWSPVEKQIVSRPLLDAVVEWMRYFGLVDNLSPMNYGKLGTFLELKAPGVERPLDLTAVGFGTSQVLPIVVQGLLTPRSGLFIVEQPEVHMHPKLQSRLAHFFFALSQTGVQCMVETHSDHLIDQLRLLIAKGKADVKEKIKIYFATNTEGKGTSFEEVRLSDQGMIQNWPEGFMDEGSKLAHELLDAANSLPVEQTQDVEL